ncbi:chorismate mutase [Paenimyroides ceti]
MNNKVSFNNWLTDLNAEQPFVIAGPCSAETPEQVLEIAHAIKGNVSVFRAGIWKPRTRPGGFEGVGAIGLKWLQQVKKETGMLLAIEVATAEHVRLALEYDIDVLWIGARTTVNPFAVQEIADALQNTHKVVLIKNPVNPDLSLWIGGVERLQNAGIKKLGLVHRGFSTYEKTNYRNVPEWQIAIDIKEKFPHIPLICDPSHITGNRSKVEEVAQQALDLHFDGLMIETHNHPDEAWSDAAQQVTPEQLLDIMGRLQIRDVNQTDHEFNIKLETYRERIDKLDTSMLKILGERMLIVDEIGHIKREQNALVLQIERWREVLNKMKTEGRQFRLGEDFVTSLYKAIHQESIDRQDKIINKNKF